MANPFTDHPRSVGESYGEHMGVAWSVGGALFVAALACFVHGLCPFLFRSTGSRAIVRLHGRVTGRTPDSAGFGDWTGAGV
jgi:hypothetical protein